MAGGRAGGGAEDEHAPDEADPRLRLLRRYLEEAAGQGRIALYLPGERFTIFDDTARRALQQYPQLRLDRDLDRENRGVTFVFFQAL